jgi:glc operon protein GlcG
MELTMELKYAQNIIAVALAKADKGKVQIAIAVVDKSGELVAFARMDDASPQASLLARSKAYTAARDRQKSGNLGAWAKETGKTMGDWTDPNITGIAGGIPIYNENNKVIGGLGISGMSEQDDEHFAENVLASLNNVLVGELA